MEILVAIALFAGLLFGIEVFLNQRRPRDILRGWARVAAVLGIMAICTAVGVSIMGPALRPPPSVTIGSNNDGDPSEGAFQAMVSACEKETGLVAKVNVHETDGFQNAINSYLRGTPDDVFTWFSGERMRFFAAQGLATPVSDIWAGFGGHYREPVRQASTGDDGEQYLVPMVRYPWVVLYRRSLFERNGYVIPETLDQFIAVAQEMQADGLVPFAFGDAEGWPAMGIFDILDMRMNGYRFHQDLLAGRERWTDPRVEAVFVRWVTLLPYFQDGSLEREGYQDAARAMLDGRAGMAFFGTFLGEVATDPVVHDDLDMFPFPLLGNEWDDEHAIDAPLDGYMLSRSPRNVPAAKRLLYCLSGGDAQNRYLESNANFVAAAADAMAGDYTPFQLRIQQILHKSGAVAQFLDRDTRPDFAGPDGMQRFLREFLRDPGQDLPVFLARIQSFYEGLPPRGGA